MPEFDTTFDNLALLVAILAPALSMVALAIWPRRGSRDTRDRDYL